VVEVMKQILISLILLKGEKKVKDFEFREYY
jgi:hypothetical protein